MLKTMGPQERATASWIGEVYLVAVRNALAAGASPEIALAAGAVIAGRLARIKLGDPR